jgi:hypothetical protein
VFEVQGFGNHEPQGALRRSHGQKSRSRALTAAAGREQVGHIEPCAS